MKILYFPKKIPVIFFCDPCFYATVQNFRLLDYDILLHATVLGMTLKGLKVFVFNKLPFWLVRLI